MKTIKMKNKIGFTAGNFDLLHPGYIYTLEETKQWFYKYNPDFYIITLDDERIGNKLR